MATGPHGGEAIFLLVAMGGLMLVMLAGAVWMAARSRRPAPPKTARRTFEHGRRLARARRIGGISAALDALRHAPVGAVVDARADEREARITLGRKRNQPCAQAAGFLAGVFESAWAHEVRVVHPVCAGERGGECHFRVEWATSASDAPEEAASTRGSGGARRRSPRARAGGG